MSGFLLVETQDPFDSADCERFWELAEGLADRRARASQEAAPAALASGSGREERGS